MDRTEAIRLLKSGPDGIKEWNVRRQTDEELPSLKGADLSDLDLSGADFSDTDLSNANLSSSNLSGVNLRRTDFSNADLRYIGLGLSWQLRFSFERLPFVLNDTRIRGTRFSPGVADPWSILRVRYTGPLTLFHVMFFVAFITPYVARTAFWVGFAEIEHATLRPYIAFVRSASKELSTSKDVEARIWAEAAATALSENRFFPASGIHGDAARRVQIVNTLV